jgi:hypothetical protein
VSPKKKKKAANTLSPNEARARECDLARRMARWITKANDYWRRAANAEPDSNEQRVATGTAENFSHMVGFWITNIDNPAKILHLVADALDGNLSAQSTTTRTGKRSTRRCAQEAASMSALSTPTGKSAAIPSCLFHQKSMTSWQSFSRTGATSKSQTNAQRAVA